VGLLWASVGAFWRRRKLRKGGATRRGAAASTAAASAVAICHSGGSGDHLCRRCLTTCWELLRQVRRLVSQDNSESHRQRPPSKGVAAPAATPTHLLRHLRWRWRTGTGPRVECRATTAPVEEELGLGWPLVYMPLEPTRVTRPCPRGPEAIGLGPDWSGVRDGRRAGLDRAEGADIRRTGPTRRRATGQ
jgi:hypothetical protein